MAGDALVITDMLNPYEHDDADVLAANVEPMVEPLARLVRGAEDAGLELIYVNDNYGDFAASRDDIVRVHPSLQRPLARDAVAQIDDELVAAALRMMERNMRAELVDVADLVR